MDILAVDNVKRVFMTGDKVVCAVDGISYTFKKGVFYALMGKSGCGKSTLLTLMAGLDKPSSGTVMYMGEDIAKLNINEYRLHNTAMIYQSYNLLPLMNVMENVMFPLRLSGLSKADAKKRAAEYLEKVSLDDGYYKRLPGLLSGGEQQRVAIARALSTEADIILADEPTGNLDVENGNNIVNLLSSVAHDFNRCVIMVTHDMEIKNRVDCVINIKDGKFIDD